MEKENVINKIIRENNYKKYLEIGYQFGFCYNRIECETKIAVDPICMDNNIFMFKGTSDEFFDREIKFQGDPGFDIIFIDGLHHADQVMKDICNASRCLSLNGCILLHDITPETEEMTQIPRKTKIWTGDVYMAWHGFREAYPDIETIEHPVKFGLGAIYPKGQIIKEFKYDHITWKYYQDYQSTSVF